MCDGVDTFQIGGRQLPDIPVDRRDPAILVTSKRAILVEFCVDADHLMADAIRIVASLYQDGTLGKPKSYASAFPDLFTFHDAPTPIEQKLFVMFLEHRMRTFQGSFHSSPDYALWYGWSEMVRDLSEIREAAADLRAKARKPERERALPRKG